MAKLKSFSLANGAVTRVTVGGLFSPASRVTHMLGELVVPEQPLWKPIVAGPPAPTMLYVMENKVPVVGAVVDEAVLTSPRGGTPQPSVLVHVCPRTKTPSRHSTSPVAVGRAETTTPM